MTLSGCSSFYRYCINIVFSPIIFMYWTPNKNYIYMNYNCILYIVCLMYLHILLGIVYPDNVWIYFYFPPSSIFDYLLCKRFYSLNCFNLLFVLALMPCSFHDYMSNLVSSFSCFYIFLNLFFLSLYFEYLSGCFCFVFWILYISTYSTCSSLIFIFHYYSHNLLNHIHRYRRCIPLHRLFLYILPLRGQILHLHHLFLYTYLFIFILFIICSSTIFKIIKSSYSSSLRIVFLHNYLFYYP